MTTAPVSAAVPIARVRTPARKQAAPTRQRISTTVLVVGTVLSLGSLAGPDWALRVGVIIALASAVASCALAWRELYLTKRQHAQDLLVVGRQHTEDLRTERQHNAEVLDTVSARAQRWRGEVDRQQTQIAGLRVEVSALRSDLTSVRRQLVRADGVITGLRETVRDRDVEIALLRTPADSGAGADRHEVDAELHVWAGRLDHIEAPALPNFEADRQSA